ncbi:GCN5-related N-acetyltransferase [Moritella sp. JT01]|uniref:GNAT family N-acetyltransferase n=1 Tax=Moritella sp. JT01 TaxID=756698 RepID=UPI000793B19B|nr:GNAT family N-acetyltransferase [Moritella sp. JT01]KXO12990.1 GCN5-related N-acetyltransferase [Moritella sp. JT01]
MSIRTIKETDWDAIMQIQSDAYASHLHEDLTVLKSKWTASPTSCFVFTNRDSRVLGYLLAHPWSGEQAPKLGEAVVIDTSYSEVYLHDLAISGDARGLGIARQLILHFIIAMQNFGCQRLLLTAVQDSASFWHLYGFSSLEHISVCPSYGQGAKLMVLTIQAHSKLHSK